MKKDPERDCRKYNVKARANEIFTSLDLDKNGFVDEDEFIAGRVWILIFTNNISNSL